MAPTAPLFTFIFHSDRVVEERFFVHPMHKDILMPISQAILDQNAHSLTLVTALPAFQRVVQAHHNYQAGFLLLLRWWLTPKANRRSENRPTAKVALQLLEEAQKMRQTDMEEVALEIIGVNWEDFAPAEYLEGI